MSSIPADKAWPMEKLFKITRALLRKGRQGVSKVAFKLTKSNISQIRLWLFLREWKREVAEAERGWRELKKRHLKKTREGDGEGGESSWGKANKKVRSLRQAFKKKERGERWSGREEGAYFRDCARCWLSSSHTERRMNPSARLPLQDFITCVEGGLNTQQPTSSISAVLSSPLQTFMYFFLM